MAEGESTSTSENTKWAVQKRFQNGTFKISYPPYGYDWDGEEMNVNPAQAEIVRQIFSAFLSGIGINQIAKEFNDHQIPTKKGGRWSHGTIKGILTNEKYMGDALLQKTYTVDFLTKQRVENTGELPKFFVKQNHPSIVSKDIFYRTQIEKLRRGYFKQQEAGRPSRYPIMPKLICRDCGEHFNRVTQTKEERRNVVWRCKNRLEHGNRCCDKLYTIPEQNLHKAIWEAFNCITHTKQSAAAINSQEMWGITKQLKECEKEILEAVKQQIQGFREWENLAVYYAKCKKEYNRLTGGCRYKSLVYCIPYFSVL